MRDAALAVGVGLEVGQRLDATVDTRVAHLLEADGRDEAGRLPSLADLAVELVHLLEREALGLVDHGEDKGHADEAEGAPDEEDLDAEVRVAVPAADEVGGRVGDGEVEQPVGGGGHRERLGAHLEREELAGDDPGDRTPGTGEEEDVEAHEGDEDLVRGDGAGRDADDGDDVLADAHADGAEQEQRTSSPLLDQVQTREGRDDVDDVDDEGRREGVLDAGILEELGAVVCRRASQPRLLPRRRRCRTPETAAEADEEEEEEEEDAQKMKLTPVNCCRACRRQPVARRLPRVPLTVSR